MFAGRLLVAAVLASMVSAYADFLTNPELKWANDWNKAVAERRAPRAAAQAAHFAVPDSLVARDVAAAAASTMTRGSQPNPTQPCFNVYQISPPVDNPSGPGPNGAKGFGYQQPRSNDVRGPCPALNTLANHGYLPRDGRLINGSNLVSAFNDGWGIDESVIAIAKTNALAVCGFESGGSENDAPYEQCEAFDLNILNAPHQFEHDHSLSRKDYEEKSSVGPRNNHIFDGTVFNQSLDVLQDSCYMTIPQANEVRLQRESDQFVADKPGWFTLAPGVQETEIGFIFAVMSENNQPGGSGQALGASVRVNWWQYWFMYESFPTPLGWTIPSPAVKNAFVTSISSLVQSATITSTPSPFFSEFVFGPSGSTTETKSNGVTFQPTLPNLYTTQAQFNKRVAEATPTPDLQAKAFRA